MTKREAAIVSVYTGVLIGDFSDFYAYAVEIMGRRSHLSRESICKYLKGQRMPTLKALMNLSYALRCNIEELTPFIQLID